MLIFRKIDSDLIMSLHTHTNLQQYVPVSVCVRVRVCGWWFCLGLFGQTHHTTSQQAHATVKSNRLLLMLLRVRHSNPGQIQLRYKIYWYATHLSLWVWVWFLLLCVSGTLARVASSCVRAFAANGPLIPKTEANANMFIRSVLVCMPICANRVQNIHMFNSCARR